MFTFILQYILIEPFGQDILTITKVLSDSEVKGQNFLKYRRKTKLKNKSLMVEHSRFARDRRTNDRSNSHFLKVSELMHLFIAFLGNKNVTANMQPNFMTESNISWLLAPSKGRKITDAQILAPNLDPCY